MEHLKVTDEWLYRYMPVVDMAIIQKLEHHVDTNYEFSHKFEHRMKRLNRKEAHPWIETVQKVVKRVAVFFLGIIGAAFVFSMNVEAYRVKLFETIRTLWEDSILYDFFTYEETKEFEILIPTYIPSGYEEIDRVSSEVNLSIVYENGNGELITWDQMLVNNTSYALMDSEYDTLDKRVVDGGVVNIALYTSGYACAYYEFEQYVFILTGDSLEVEDIILMLESMEH